MRVGDLSMLSSPEQPWLVGLVPAGRSCSGECLAPRARQFELVPLATWSLKKDSVSRWWGCLVRRNDADVDFVKLVTQRMIWSFGGGLKESGGGLI